MAEKNLFQNDNSYMGVENSLYNKVSWHQQDRHLSEDEVVNLAVHSGTQLFHYDNDLLNFNMKPGNNYFHTLLSPATRSLSAIYESEYGQAIPSSTPRWNGFINVTHNNFLGIDNLNLIAEMHGVPHSHTVLKNLFFQDLEVKLRFYRNDGSVYYHYVPLPNPVNYYSSVGVEGTIGGNKKDYQMGMKQIFYYYVKIDQKYIGIKLELSIVLAYASNDFEPMGVIDAVKFFPQIRFSEDAISKNDSELFPDYYDLFVFPDTDPRYTLLPLSGLPSDIDINSCGVGGFKGRVKMTANNNNMHHVDIRGDGNGNLINYDSFRTAREQNIDIPSIFESYYDLSVLSSNMPGFFTDSNSAEDDEKDDIRKFPFYHFSGAMAPPTWAYIFDYVKPDIKEEFEINAVYGRQDLPTMPTAFDKEREASYIYPPGNPEDKKITLTKLARQGEYDNIHFHGYLGHYADNNEPVIHAPICGYCCFHLHWRWSKLNYDLNANKIIKLVLASGRPNRFNGWDTFGRRSGEGYGLPLIPPNQSLKIAITNENKIPYSRDSVLNPAATPAVLDNTLKTVWYSVDVLDYSIRSHSGYVVMEHGAGYAFRYNPKIESMYNTAKTMIRLLKYKWSITVPGAPLTIPGLVIEFIDDIMNIAEPADFFEITYRIMRFYNWEPPYSNVNQVPYGDYQPDLSKPSMEKL